MSTIAVCPLSRLEQALRQTGATHMISLLSGDTKFSRPDQIDVKKHLILQFNDITTAREGLVSPAETHIARLIRFAGNWDRKTPLLVHCWAGISRSPAAAVIICAALEPSRNVSELASSLRTLSPSATPNIKMIELADAILKLNGRLFDAIEEIGRGEDAFEGNPFTLAMTAIPVAADINAAELQ